MPWRRHQAVVALIVVMASAGPADGQCRPHWAEGFFVRGADRSIGATCVFDDGTDTALYADGLFNSINGVAVNRIARWDGRVWQAIGSGMGGEGDFNQVGCMIVFDDGRGPALYAGGHFATADGITAFAATRHCSSAVRLRSPAESFQPTWQDGVVMSRCRCAPAMSRLATERWISMTWSP